MLGAVTITRLEKAATDNGFVLEVEHKADWPSFGSSQTPMRILLTASGDSRFLATASRTDVFDGLNDGRPADLVGSRTELAKRASLAAQSACAAVNR